MVSFDHIEQNVYLNEDYMVMLTQLFQTKTTISFDLNSFIHKTFYIII